VLKFVVSAQQKIMKKQCYQAALLVEEFESTGCGGSRSTLERHENKFD
jgi:hypothetical protein